MFNLSYLSKLACAVGLEYHLGCLLIHEYYFQIFVDFQTPNMKIQTLILEQNSIFLKLNCLMFSYTLEAAYKSKL